MSTDIVLAFPFFLTQISFDVGLQELLDVDHFIRSRTITNLGWIRDVDNPLSKEAKMGAIIIREAYEVRGNRVDTTGLTVLGETYLKSA